MELVFRKITMKLNEASAKTKFATMTSRIEKTYVHK